MFDDRVMLRFLSHSSLTALTTSLFLIMAGCSADTPTHSRSAAQTQVTPPASTANESQSDWYEVSRFGMFIHWGLYSDAAGQWQDRRYFGITEWLMRRSRSSTAEYSVLAETFNPTEFDAKEWVRVAKEAGMKYIVITAKHHDGFAMFDTDASEFNILDATPFGRDPLKELAIEAEKEGIRLGFYYSQFQDWTDPNAGGNDWEFDPVSKNFAEYSRTKALPQIEELLSNYGDIGIVWFDTPGDITRSEATEFRDWVRRLQPDTLISSRIGHDLGDFQTMRDGEVPTSPREGLPWEAIFTHNDSWGYSAFDKNFKSTTQLLRTLSTVAGRGGNLMINVGPDGKGRLPEETVSRFKAVGDWLNDNGLAIYGTSASPIGEYTWGTATQREGHTYLHIFKRPKSGIIQLENVEANPTALKFLSGMEAIEWRKAGKTLSIKLPDTLPDERVTIIDIEHEGPFGGRGWDADTIVDRNFDTVEIPLRSAELTSGATYDTTRYYLYFGDWKYYDHISGIGGNSQAAWTLDVKEPGEYRIEIDYIATREQARQEGVISIAGQRLPFRTLLTEDIDSGLPINRPHHRLTHHLGIVHFDAAGSYKLSLEALNKDSTEGSIMTLTGFTIHPTD